LTQDLGDWMSNGIDEEGKSFQTEINRNISVSKLGILRNQMKNTTEKRNMRILGLSLK
jgi:hypothetical protein